MMWRRLTVALLTACIATCAWIYLRDRPTGPVSITERRQAQLDANQIRDLLANSKSCGDGCSADVLGRMASASWRVRIAAPTWQRCFIVSLGAFGYSDEHGLSGLRTASCNRPG